MLDHKDRQKRNDCIENLRLATEVLNATNREQRSGKLPKGVTFMKKKKAKPYMAQVQVGGVHKNLGYYNTPEEASAARILFDERIRHA